MSKTVYRDCFAVTASPMKHRGCRAHRLLEAHEVLVVIHVAVLHAQVVDVVRAAHLSTPTVLTLQVALGSGRHQ